jgi:hypothetical protein
MQHHPGVLNPLEHPMRLDTQTCAMALATTLFAGFAIAADAQTIGRLSANPFQTDSTSNPFSQVGSPFSPSSIRNPHGRYGSPHSPQSVTNPYATETPRLYDSQGNYRGKLSANPYDPDSISNPHGRYGSPHSPDSLNNPHGAGSPYRHDSPNNPHGQGWTIVAPK